MFKVVGTLNASDQELHKTVLLDESISGSKGDALAIDATTGYAIKATSSSTRLLIAAQDYESAAGEHPEVLVYANPACIFEADTNANTAQAQVGDAVDLTDHDTVNNAATSVGVVRVLKVLGAAADKKIHCTVKSAFEL